MRLNKIETRELRSFKIRLKTLTLKSFFDQTDNLAVFMMSDNIQPENRLEIRKQFAKYDLELVFLSKKTLNLWMKEPEWVNLKNLLSGNVVQIQIKKDNSTITPEYLNTVVKFLIQQPYLDLRCIIWNQQIYRKEKLVHYVQTSQTQNKAILLDNILTAPIRQSLLGLGLFFNGAHYKK